MNMKSRYRLFLPPSQKASTTPLTTLNLHQPKTKDKAEANRLLMAMNEAGRHPP